MRVRALVVALSVCAGGAWAQPDPVGPPDEERLVAMMREGIRETQQGRLNPVARSAIDATYLTDDERADLRVRHGVWTDADLEDPRRAARAAIIRGAYDDAALVHPDADAHDRAEAMWMLGQGDDAIRLLDGLSTMRSHRIRAWALFDLGRYDDADRAAQPAIDAMLSGTIEDADELAEGVRVLLIRDRIRGAQRGASDYSAMVVLLARARDELDPLSWTARLVEAELLYEKSSRTAALQAVQEALSYNPSSARAWRLLGELLVDQFNLAAVDQVTTDADRIAAPADWDPAAWPPASLHSTLVRVRARLRQSDAEGAAELLLDLPPEFDENAGVRAATAAASAARFEYDRVDELLAFWDEASGGRPVLGYHAVGRTLSGARQYGPAARYLEEAARRAPNWSPPVVELGLLEMQSGRDDRARTALRTAVELDPFNLRAANSLELAEELARYTRVETEHFVIRYRPGIDAALAADMPAIMERIHDRVSGPGGFDHEPEQKTVIELMPDRRWFGVRITGMPQLHTVAAATGPVIAFESPQVGPGFSIGIYDWPRVLQHEYAHTVTLSRTRNRIPHWFTEAAAVWVEDAPRDFRTWSLLREVHDQGRLFDLDEINIAFVRPERPTDRGQAYAQGHWMYQFIVDGWGVRAPLDLMDRYAEGETEHTAMPTVLGISPDEFVERFERWAGEQLVAVGLRLPEGVPTVSELVDREIEEFGLEPSDETRAEFAPDAGFAVRWLAEYPEHPDLLELSIRTSLQARQNAASEEMVPILRMYAAARPVDPLPHRLLAQLFLNSDSASTRLDAIPHLQWLDDRSQYEAFFAASLVPLLAERGDLTAAGESADRATHIAPFNASFREQAARLALQNGRLEDARRHITALTIIEPDREVHRERLDAIDARLGGG